MFTGLIQKIGKVKRVSRGKGLVLEISFEPWARELEFGESIAVNGVCLTVSRFDATRFTADVLQETEERTTLSALMPGEKVNLERALKSGDALGGHLVQGHVDACGRIIEIIKKGRDEQMRIFCGKVIAAQSVLKGSVAIDGVSLTISSLGDDYLGVDLIPTTRQDTTLGFKKIGDRVNIETDIVGKYVTRAQKQSEKNSALTLEALANAGFL